MNIQFNICKTPNQPKLMLVDKKNKYIGYKNMTEGVNSLEIDLNEIKIIYFKIGKKRTEDIILASNMQILNLYFNKKTKAYQVSIEANLENFGKVQNVFFTDQKNLDYKKKGDKKISLYFSPNFKNKDVHLLVFFDSQNIYDQTHVNKYTTKADIYGGWQIDVPISLSKKNFIVLGIENADIYRSKELSITTDKKYIRNDYFKEQNEGKLDNMERFIEEKCLPYLSKYKIIDIGIAGASMGGLAAHYLGIKYQNIYKYIFSLSPASSFYFDSYWRELYKYNKFDPEQKFFYYCGGYDNLEKELQAGNKNLVKNLVDAGYKKENILKYVNDDLKHNEISWRYAFNYAFNEFYNK